MRRGGELVMQVHYGIGFQRPSAPRIQEGIDRMRQWLDTQQPYEPDTRHHFHAGMYCREVWRDAGVMVIGKVHKKEHFYFIVSGTVAVTTDDGEEVITGPRVLKCKAGTQRAVFALTPVVTMTVHICKARTVEGAERELVEDDESSPYGPGNVLKTKPTEVLP
jgi:mannose-6-phosphate isomerase-like protein (cupin superfamily)